MIMLGVFFFAKERVLRDYTRCFFGVVLVKEREGCHGIIIRTDFFFFGEGEGWFYGIIVLIFFWGGRRREREGRLLRDYSRRFFFCERRERGGCYGIIVYTRATIDRCVFGSADYDDHV